MTAVGALAWQQAPVPPLPPEFPVIAQGGPPEEVFFALFAALAVVVAGIVLYPLARALARRLEGRGRDESVRTELEQLHERVERLEQVESRLYELENRMEFSERLLAQQRGALLERPEE